MFQDSGWLSSRYQCNYKLFSYGFFHERLGLSHARRVRSWPRGCLDEAICFLNLVKSPANTNCGFNIIVIPAPITTDIILKANSRLVFALLIWRQQMLRLSKTQTPTRNAKVAAISFKRGKNWNPGLGTVALMRILSMCLAYLQLIWAGCLPVKAMRSNARWSKSHANILASSQKRLLFLPFIVHEVTIRIICIHTVSLGRWLDADKRLAKSRPPRSTTLLYHFYFLFFYKQQATRACCI